MMVSRSRARVAVTTAAALLALVALGPASALAASGRHDAGEESHELEEAIASFSEPRAAPAETAPAAAWPAAASYVKGVAPVDATPWNELGPYNYFTDDSRYLAQPFSNNGSGAGFNTGRMTAIAALKDGRTVYAGAADGGVWKSTDAGTNWTPLFDQQETMSIGALAVDEAGRTPVVYAGTGEANTSGDSYAGIGILKSADGGKSWSRVGGDELVGALVFKIVVDPVDHNRLYAATSHGLYRWTSGASSWTRILGDAPGSNLQVANMVTDVAVRPGSGGATGQVLAVRGWREGAATNGLYLSKDGGGHFTALSPQGYVPAQSQGRVSLAWSRDGSQLYAVVQDPQALALGKHTILKGIYSAKGGDPNAPWNQIASPSNLQNSGSAMKPGDIGVGYQPGVQAWYNQWVTVDPADASHVYVGLEEVYESVDAGHNWVAAAPYWNLTLDCFSLDPFPGTCPNTTHSDQHAATISGGRLWVGNDGGVFSRPLSAHGAGGNWTSHNARLNTLQYYFADSGRDSKGRLNYWGGLQDNGTSKLIPGTSKYAPVESSEPFGGDGGDTLVDPTNPDNVITEYTGLDMAVTQDGGVHWLDVNPNDPLPRFIAPFTADQHKLSDLYAGGEYVWKSGKGFKTTASDWAMQYDQGAGRSTTALDAAGGTVYAAWCGPCNPSFATGQGFKSGIATNAGGAWHQLTPPLSTRYPTAVAVDPANAQHVYVTYSGYSRHWVVGPYDAGVGHVFETTDGGLHWADISGGSAGGLVDAPANDVLIVGDRLVVATDLGAFASGLHGGTWQRLGTGLPNVVVNDLALTPGADPTVLAATHGRGLWTIPVAALVP
jgi:photosystem II stability/assembly factor-like uncharacterized protein